MSGWASSQIVTLLLAAALIIALVSEGWLILYLLRQNGRLLLRMDNLEEVLNAAGIASNTVIRQPVSGLPIGSSAPSFELPVVSGGRLTLDAMLGADKPVLLIFSDPNCVPCDALMPDIAYWERDHASKLTLALISRGGMEANHAKTIMYGLRNMLIQQDREVAEKYQAYVTPSAVLVHPNGSIGTYLAVGPQAIAELVARTTDTGVPIPLSVAAGNGHHKDSHTAPLTGSELKIGESAPLFNLPDLKGHSVKLNDFKGRDTIIIFWNPTCGFCNNMLPALRAWERNRQGKVPELLMISTGTVEANQSMELQSTVVLDQSFSAGRAFGVGGTPSAVLINAEGKIASAIAVGAPEVLALAAGPKRLNVDRQYAGL
jgi:peroxiredoxin